MKLVYGYLQIELVAEDPRDEIYLDDFIKNFDEKDLKKIGSHIMVETDKIYKGNYDENDYQTEWTIEEFRGLGDLEFPKKLIIQADS